MASCSANLSLSGTWVTRRRSRIPGDVYLLARKGKGSPRTQPRILTTSSFASLEEGSNPRALLFPKFDLETSVGSTMVRCASLQDLDDSTDRWAIVVRVFRKWNVYQKYAPAELFCVSMVLIDEEGRTIQASVLNNRNLLDKFQISIVEGQIYKFANFEVTSNVNQYRASSHPFKITFTPRTSSAKAIATIPTYAYSFFPIPEIMKIDFLHPVYKLIGML
ncbi:hypothetical protein K1719_005953 [Acacia pycnantha]|nr:hypothetical protein K1719_005953 [Acacia pycnantha]